MTVDQGNIYIAKFLGLKLKSDGKTWELSKEISNILKAKTTQFLKFNESLELMHILVEKLATIKDCCLCYQFNRNEVYISMLYKAELIEGEWRRAKFSCERTKSIDKFKQGLFEVLSTFCGWYYEHPDCQTEIEYDSLRTEKEDPYIKVFYEDPKQVICPKCGKIYREKDVKEKDKN